jgi:hypothetical protein
MCSRNPSCNGQIYWFSVTQNGTGVHPEWHQPLEGAGYPSGSSMHALRPVHKSSIIQKPARARKACRRMSRLEYPVLRDFGKCPNRSASLSSFSTSSGDDDAKRSSRATENEMRGSLRPCSSIQPFDIRKPAAGSDVDLHWG